MMWCVYIYLTKVCAHFLHKVTKCTETIGSGAERVTHMACPETPPAPPQDDKMELEAVGRTSSKTRSVSGVKVTGVSDKYKNEMTACMLKQNRLLVQHL